jgi:hypothetical protein
MQKNSGWTLERRKKQSEAIRQWKPWNQSTGAKSIEGKQRVGRNAYKGGHRSKLREIIKMVNAEVRASRELIALC